MLQVMRVLDLAGAHLSDVDGLRLAKLLEHVEAAIELVDGCGRPGVAPQPQHSSLLRPS